MLDLPDPVSDLLGIFFKRALDSKLAKRLELLLELFIAFVISFLIACGSALVSGQPVAWSIGIGMVTSGVCMLATFQGSQNSKGLTISVQSDIEKIPTVTEKK